MPKPVESYAGRCAPFAPKRLALAILSALAIGFAAALPVDAHAAGLGRITVQSGLGQPLRAEIEVTTATADELQSLQVKLASAEAFQQAGIELNAALMSIRLNVERQNSGRAVVRMTSAQPISEPYVDLLLEMSWASGRLIREYTFLLDPPELRMGRGADTVAPAIGATPSVAAPATRPLPTPAAPAAAPVQQAAGTPPHPAAVGGGEYEVKRGDTLGKIAAQARPESATLDQMLVALFRTNPEAFAGNMNRLKTGAILRVPDAAQATSVESGEARRIVSAQTADFAAYRARLAGSVAAGAAKAPEGEQLAASGQVTPTVEDQAAPKSPIGDQVKLARPQDAAAKGGTVGGGADAVVADQIAAKDKAIAESRQRIAELERNVTDLKGLIATQSKVGAEAQKLADAKKADDAKQSDATKKPEETRKAEEAKQAEPAKASEDAMKATPEAAKPADVAAPPEAPKPAEPVKPATKPEPARVDEGPGLIDSIISNPLALGGGAAIIALLGGYLLYSRSRKKRFEKFQDSILTGGDLKANSIFGTTGGQSVDTTDSTFNSNFTPSASQIDSNEVDPIAEADVYIAYGRDAQAEEILKEALKNTPDRHAVRVKLLEIYASRRDLPAFESIAGELYSRTGGKGEDWERAATLGRSLDPRNPLYGGSSDAVTATATGVGALASSAAVMDHSATIPGFVSTRSTPVDVDFDLDLDRDRHEPLKESTPVDFELGGAAEDDVLNKTSPSLDFNPTVPVPRTELMESGTATAPTIDFDIDAPPLLPIDAIEPRRAQQDVPVLEEPSLPTAEVVSTTPRDTLDFDIDLPENIELAAADPPRPPVPGFDLSGISLDFASAPVAQSTPAVAETASNLPVGKQQEMATKLDLAAAYQEIGDREGAQELLDEVMRGGDPNQQQRAKRMLETLG